MTDNIKALLIKPDNTVERITLPREGRLRAINEALGGYMQVLPVVRNDTEVGEAIFNEDGKQLRLPYNELATEVIGRDRLLPGDFIVGPMIVTGPVRRSNETSISDKLADEIMALAHRFAPEVSERPAGGIEL
jgi:hypothetical protein